MLSNEVTLWHRMSEWVSSLTSHIKCLHTRHDTTQHMNKANKGKFLNIYLQRLRSAHERNCNLSWSFYVMAAHKIMLQTIFANFYLWAGNRHEYFKVRDSTKILLVFLKRESLIRLCRRDFVLFIYACILPPTSFVRAAETKHNFNTNLFMLCCCKTSFQINLNAVLKLQSTSLVAFFFEAKIGSFMCLWRDCHHSRPTKPCTSIYT